MTQPPTKAIKFDDGKPPMSLISRELMEELATVRGFGAKKYSPNGWKDGFLYSRGLSAAMRHIMAFNDGEDNDPESGLCHLGHAIASLEHVLYAFKTLDKEKFDDRYKKPQ